jgi:tetratricopeptide (TPR) repeat protein
VFLAQGEARQAVGEYQAVARAQPKLYDAQLKLGMAQQQAGQLREAQAAYQAAVRLNPRSATALQQHGLDGRTDRPASDRRGARMGPQGRRPGAKVAASRTPWAGCISSGANRPKPSRCWRRSVARKAASLPASTTTWDPLRGGRPYAGRGHRLQDLKLDPNFAEAGDARAPAGKLEGNARP